MGNTRLAFVKLVEYRLMGFSIDPATAFKPASEYPTASKVPEGSYLWMDDVRPPAPTP